MAKRKERKGALGFLAKVEGPMLAISADKLPAGEWVLEPKFDGFRALAAVSAGEVTLISRNGKDLAERFPLIAKALERSDLDEVVLDGEIISSDSSGAVRFELTQQGAGEQAFVVFDILYRDGEDLRKRPLEERRRILEEVVAERAPIRLVPRIDATPDEALRQSREQGDEGVIAKKAGSLYEQRRSKAWLKLKLLDHQEFVIVGYKPLSNQKGAIGSLLLAVRDGRTLRYAGRVGTGFSAEARGRLFELLSMIESDQAPVSDPPRIRDAVWVEPRLVGEVRFTEWTRDGLLRHPSFLGLREDKKPSDVVREKTVDVVDVRFTSPDRVLYPRDGITKRDLAEYYEAMSEPLLLALEERPVALEHWNEGIDEESWYEQSVGKGTPEWVSTIDTPTRTRRGTATHPIIDRPEALRWLAQRSVLTIHMWASRRGSLEEPDWLVIDLDPSPKKGFQQAVEAAKVFRGLLETLEIPSVPKTSGKKGLHILIPLKKGQRYPVVEAFARDLCRTVARQVPEVTVERTIDKRKGRLYADAGQNGYGKTIVAPYSPRGVDGAPVSAPLEWKEIRKGLDPARFNIRTMPERLAKKGDLFAPLLREGVVLPNVRKESEDE